MVIALDEHDHEGSNINNDGEITFDRGVDGTRQPPWKKQQQ